MHGHELSVPWWTILPFVALLGCIAIFPLLRATSRLWHHMWFQLAVAMASGVPMAAFVWSLGGQSQVIHAVVEYCQFITLLLSLFVISGGVFVAGDIEATPRTNALLLALGATLASFIGTTGAAMLMIRPILNINRERSQKVHTVVFAIFTVANCGGLLTPLGDPPLFLGMLRGVPFLWTFNLLPAWAFVNGLLIVSYYALDRRLHAMESRTARSRDASDIEPIQVRGAMNLVWLLGVVLAVAFAPSIDLEAIAAGRARASDWIPIRELIMLTLAGFSFGFGERSVRFESNGFSWRPILEVASLFIGIFLAMVPALVYLRELAPRLPLDEYTFFLFTGALSAVLDNAPTYATFFEMAKGLGGEPAVAGVQTGYLVSISLGAVFCGAVTYIGNGPNFMVKSIADAAGIKMPSFGGYVAWALRYLIPILGLMVLVIIAKAPWLKLVGWVLTLAWIVSVVVRLRNSVASESPSRG